MKRISTLYFLFSLNIIILSIIGLISLEIGGITTFTSINKITSTALYASEQVCEQEEVLEQKRSELELIKSAVSGVLETVVALFTSKDDKEKTNDDLINCSINYCDGCKFSNGKSKWNFETPYHMALAGKNATKNILFLADMDDPNRSFCSGAKFLQKNYFGANSGVTLYQTDYSISKNDEKVSDNLICKHVDHNEEFKSCDLADQKFDVIVMKRGLCQCHDNNTTCGGIDCSLKSSDSKSAYTFINKVINLMNLKNPNSYAILHGKYGNSKFSKWNNFWKKTAEKISKVRKDISIQIDYDDIHDFVGLVIRPAPTITK
ncbi:MAG: hypothetical protein HQK49_16915 [Oligoflexia bacterium]|nr:hypothetical protein [Oligoflexia bacterium]